MSFSFGAPASTPATGGFGAAAPAAAKPAGGFSFGAPAAGTAAAPAAGGFSLGQPAAAPAAKPTLSFGAPVASAAGAAPASTGFSFGGTAPAAAPAASTGFGLGTPASSAPAPTLGFGGAASTAPTLGGLGSTSLSFGAPKTTAVAAPSIGLGFGAPAASSAPGLTLGAPASSTVGGLGGLSGFGATTTSSAAPATLNFGTATTTSTGLGGLGGATTAALPSTVGLGGSTTTQTTALGLGGAPSGFAGGADNKNGAAKTIKEQQIPQPLQAAVEELKKHVKEERSVSSDIAHISSKVHQKIQTETDGLGNLVKGLASGLAKNKAQLDCLKMEAAQELLNIEIAQRTKDTPPALQYENVAPYEYFSQLLVNFENQMLAYRRQIEETEQHLQSMASQAPSLSAEDVAMAIQKQHATFTSLASKYQKFHEEVQNQKDLFMQLHRLKYGTSSELFSTKEVNNKVPRRETRVPTTIGPSPFTGQQDILAMAKASLSARPQQQSLAAPPTFSLNSSQGFPNLNPGTTSTTLGTGLGMNQPSMGAFGAPAGNSSGIFGTTQSPFGSTFGSPSALTPGFGGNKRGKH